MQSKTPLLPFFLALFTTVFFSFRVRQNAALAEKYNIAGKFCFKLFVMDLSIYASLAVVGYYLTLFVFEFTPFLKPFDDYKYISALVMGIISEHSLPILFDSVVAIFRKKSDEVVEKI